VNWRLEGGDTWVSPAMQRILEIMHERDLTMVGFRDRKGHLRYVLSNNEIVHGQTVLAMKKRGLLEQIEPTEEANEKNEVHYRLKVK
jgi:hypothetical protein